MAKPALDTKTVTATSVDITRQLGTTLGQHLQPATIVVLSGDLGAGKTQLAAAIAQDLNINTPITSPTFAILKHYAEGRIPLNHMDLYRLEDATQLEDIDFYDLLRPCEPAATLIEWGEMFTAVTDHADLLITIRITGASERSIQLDALTPRGKELLAHV